MNFEHIIYTLEAYKCKSVSKAARNIHISQSSLSNIIINIESEIGYPIFIRTSSGIVPTPEGELFMSYAEKIITECENIKKIPQSFEKNQNISIFSTPSSFVFQCFLEFKNKYPTTNNTCDTFLEAGLKENIRGIIAQKCRISILIMFERKIPKYKNLAERYNFDFKILKKHVPMVVFMSKKHPLAKKDSIFVSDISKYNIVVDKNIDYDDTLEIFNIKEKENILFVSDRGTTFDAVRKSNYLSIGVKISPGDEEALKCCCRKVEDGENIAFCLAKPELSHLSNREIEFIDYLTKRLKEWYGVIK